jgi:hypothetical protein
VTKILPVDLGLKPEPCEMDMISVERLFNHGVQEWMEIHIFPFGEKLHYRL